MEQFIQLDESYLSEAAQLYKEAFAGMEAYLNKTVNVYFRDVVAAECRNMIEAIMKPDEAVRYIVALGKRKVLFDLLLDRIEKHVRRDK